RRCPVLSVSTPRGNADFRTYTSSPPSWETKPKPFSASYHLTLPVGTELTVPFPARGRAQTRRAHAQACSPDERAPGAEPPDARQVQRSEFMWCGAKNSHAAAASDTVGRNLGSRDRSVP